MNHRPTRAEIDLSAIAHNLDAIRHRVQPAGVMAVVKADAYGHGILEVAEIMQSMQADYLGVGLLEEGVLLRQNRIEMPILVFGGFFVEQIATFFDYDLELTLFDRDRAYALSRAAVEKKRTAAVHVKVDTGMGRIGIDWSLAVEFIESILELPGLFVKGIYTHLAASDIADKGHAVRQIERFEQVLLELRKKNIDIPLKHAANSGAILDLPDSYFNMVRPGVMLYGYYPSNETSESIALKPAMTIKSSILSIKEAATGTFVSYNLTYKTSRETKIAAVPVGYGDGYNRLLSNCGEIMVRGNRYPVVGTVCMDLVMLDLGRDCDAKVGDEVVLLGRQEDDEITIYELCEKLNTIPYEITCWLSARVPKIYSGNAGTEDLADVCEN